MKSKLNYIEKRNLLLSTTNKKKVVDKIPKNAMVELTNACNHACVFCYNPMMKRKISSLDIHSYEIFIKKTVAEGLEEVGLYSTGEPFMTKNLDEFILIAKKNGIKRVYITSNGALASLDRVVKCVKAGLDSIKFSVNAGSRSSYKITHGYDDFKNVISNIKEIYEFKNKNKINLQLLCSFVLTDLTYNEKNSFKKKFSYLFDEDIVFVHAKNQGGRTGETSNTLKKNTINKKIKNKSFTYKPCEMLWNRLHLNNKGYLTACCVDYEDDLVYTKFESNKKVLDQFNSDKIKELREKHLLNKLDGTICKNCIYNVTESYTKISKMRSNEIEEKNTKRLKDVKKRINSINNKTKEKN